MADQCARCGSTKPHLHPAVQFEGEVEVCPDDFHLRQTPQNTARHIEAVHEKRRSMPGPGTPAPASETERRET